MALQQAQERGQWGSKVGFILAAAGSAVGLGNIWRFPYMTGENGGGAFVFVYLLCVLLIGIPLLFNELALGRMTGRSPVGAFKVTGAGPLWFVAPVMCLLVCFFVLGYYSVIAGWTIGYIGTTITRAEVDFATFIATPGYVIPLFAFFLLLTIGIVLGGVSGGIERASKILMPVLLLIILVVIARSLTLPGAMEGVKYYLRPDFSRINATVVLAALGQAFFSMSVGWGLMITYGSYLSKQTNMVTGGLWVAGMDTFIALLGGLMIFPAVFAFAKEPAAGPTLVFQVLPDVFAAMPGGPVVGALFFLLLMIAALTSSISMLEVPVAYLIDERRWNRRRAAWIVGGLAFVVGIPAALSQGASPALSSFSLFGQTGVLNVMDFAFGTMGVVIICLLLSLYVGWALKPAAAATELGEGAPFFQRPIVGSVSPATLWMFFIRFICPVTIVLMLYYRITG
jgi:NSS family neurotransmitter:Na+ symporter